ncbi:MAG TPA: hypothetical protein VH063_10935, partial [Gaiellaceae bacterium]|nr:hypothetical protein [Gaiellaceae bacterium]
ELEHQNRIEKNHDHPVVRRVAEALGGGPDMVALAELLIDTREHPEKGTFAERQEELSNECPELDIWTEPKMASQAALEKLNDQELEVGLLAYMRAQNSFDRAARRFERYEDRVMKGAGIAVKWLNRAKVAGKLAAGALAGGGLLDAALMAGSYSFVQEGAQQAAEVAEGERKHMDWAGLTKGAAAEGAMALFGGVTQGAFTKAIEARIVERWGAEALADGGTRLMIGGTAAAASSFYNIGANMAVQKIIYGKANMPQSVDELATMVLDEASSAVLTDAGMQGVHHAFGEHPGAAPGEEGAGEHEGRAGTGEASGPAESHGSEGRSGAPATESAKAPDRTAAKHLELVELAESAKGSPGAAGKLLDHFGSWDNAIGALRQGAGEFALMDPAARDTAIDGLVSHREQVAGEVAGFGAAPEGGKDALGKPENTAELTVKGEDAGLKAAQAIEHLDATHPEWQRRFRMGVEVDAGRAKSISDSAAGLPKALRQELTRYQAESGEMLSTWREARAARTPELREAILERIHGPEFKAWAKQMLDITPADAAALRIQHLASSDRAFEKIDPHAPGDARFAQIKQAMDEQMLASALEPELLPAAEPLDDTDSLPGTSDRKKHLGGDKGADLVRPGSASERLEARRIIDSIEQLGPTWRDLAIPNRLDSLTAIANRPLAARGIPNVDVVMVKGAAGTGGHFDFTTWKIAIDPEYIKADTLPPELVTYLSGLERHEGDHAIQWWEMARLRAAEGDDAATIAAKMKLDPDVAVQAVEVVKRDGPPSAAERARAQEVWESVYGEHADDRKSTNARRASFAAKLDSFNKTIDGLQKSGAQFDKSVWEEKSRLTDAYLAADYLYKALPEENRSYTVDGIVKAEASLVEAEREFEFAEIALDHAEGAMKDVENEMRAELFGKGRTPSPELEADRTEVEAQIQKLQRELEKVRTKRKMLEGYVQGGEREGP